MTTRIGKFLVAMLLLAAVPAHAQLFRTYLAIDGSDANPCTLPLPCRLLPAALAAVADGGEVWMLDSGNYNTTLVTVTKSVTILAVPGALGSVVALGGNAIDITTASITVTLRNLNIVPFPGYVDQAGIVLAAASRVLVQGCNLNGFVAGDALRATGAGREVAIVDSVFANNNRSVLIQNGASATVSGTHFSDSYVAVHALSVVAAKTRVRVSRSTATRGSYGMIVESYSNASAATDLAITDSAIDSMGVVGSYAYSELGADSRVAITNSLYANNDNGIQSLNSGARVVIRNNTITHNTNGVVQSGSAYFETRGGNTITDNTANIIGVLTPVAAN